MDDLISRKALIEMIKSLSITIGGKDVFPNHVKSSVLDAVEFSPAVDAEPVRLGEWIHLGGDEWCCNKCGEVINTERSWDPPRKKFCYECGAKMDGGKDTNAPTNEADLY